MSQDHVTCSATTSDTVHGDEASSRVILEDTFGATRIPRFCVNEVPWRLAPQILDDGEAENEFLDDEENRLSDVESFVWKWSPCGRYGIDMPGGRDVINQQLTDRVAVFDLHMNSWEMYRTDVDPSTIPRVCFLYWVRYDTVAIVSLIKDKDAGQEEEVVMKFRQCFYYVCHQTKALELMAQCKYCTDKKIAATYWYHIFENRRGEPFIDHENNAWLVFSNGKDSLILLPYLPTPTSYKPKFVEFDMDRIFGSFINTRVFLDPFISSHFVPWVYRNEINFFIRVDEMSFTEDRDRDFDQDFDDSPDQDKCGMYQLRINLKDVIERCEKNSQASIDILPIEPTFDQTDVKFFRKLSDSSWHAHECFTQHGKMVVLLRWEASSILMRLSRELNTRVCDSQFRERECCVNGPRDFSFCTIDLEDEKVKTFDSLILGTDVILPHPSGSMYMFRYKEDYGTRLCELPYFEPLSLQLKCAHVISKTLQMDPTLDKNICCLKKRRNSVRRLRETDIK